MRDVLEVGQRVGEREHGVELGADLLPVGFEGRDPREVGRLVERLHRQLRLARDRLVDALEQPIAHPVRELDQPIPRPYLSSRRHDIERTQDAVR